MKNNKYKLSRFLVLPFVLFGLIETCWAAGSDELNSSPPDRGQITCPLYKAVYKPGPSFYERANRKLDYTLTIQPALPNQTTERWDDYLIHTFKNETRQEVSRYRLSLICSNGDKGCTLNSLDYLPLNSDFSIVQSSENAPYAIIIPNLGQSFRSIDWKKSKNIQFLTDEKIVPSSNAISVWLLDTCSK